MKEKYLVTGALGHLGLTIVKRLKDEKKEVRVLIRPHNRKEKYLPKDVEIIYGDVTNKDDLKPFFKKDVGYDNIVIHCAAIVSIASKYDQNVYNVNVNGVKNIVDLCLETKVKKLIHVSSVHAIKEKDGIMSEQNDFDPNEVHGLYAKTKAEASHYVIDATKKGLDATIVHPSGIFGPNDYGPGHLTELIIDYYNHRLTAAVKGGYDFVDVRDVTDGILKAIKKGKKGECYLLTNKYYQIPELMDILADITKHKKIKTYLPIWFAKFSAPLSELYYKILKQPPLYTSYSLYTLESKANFSHEKATRELDYHPRDLKITLEDTITFLKENKIID